jgi:hypothetical protein
MDARHAKLNKLEARCGNCSVGDRKQQGASRVARETSRTRGTMHGATGIGLGDPRSAVADRRYTLRSREASHGEPI